MSDAPFLSVLIPTRNRCDLLSRALDSILSDPSPHLEVVVSDNASSDETIELPRKYRDVRVRWFRQDVDLGMVGNWNFCVDAARGERVLLLSDDDFVAPGFASAIAMQARELRSVSLAFTAYKLVCGGQVLTSFDGSKIRFTAREFLTQVLRGRIHVQLCSALFERSFLARHRFRTDMVYAMDMEAWVSHVDDRGVAVIPGATAFYSIHPGNASTAIALSGRFAEDVLITRLLVSRLRAIENGVALWTTAAKRNMRQARYLAGTTGLPRLARWALAARLFAGVRRRPNESPSV